MLGRITLTVRFLSDASYAGMGGEAVHGFVMSEVAKVNKKYAEELHRMSEVKPFSVSPLFIKDGGARREGGFLNVEEGSVAEIIVSSLNQKTTEIFMEVFTESFEGKKALNLGSGRVMIEKVGLKSSEGGEFSTFGSIMKKASTKRTFEFNILTPMSFRHKGINIPFPLSELVFSSLLRTWNAFSGVKIPVSIRDKFNRVVVSKYDLKTEVWRFSTYMITGCKGRVRYVVDDEFIESEVKIINALSIFANFSGIGYKRTMGMGMVEVRL